MIGGAIKWQVSIKVKRGKKQHNATVKCKTGPKLLQRRRGLCKMNENIAAPIGKTLKGPTWSLGSAGGLKINLRGR